MNQQDNLFREIASGYVEIYGGEINRENLSTGRLDTTRLERSVKAGLRAVNRRRFLRYGALAACVLLAILLPLTIRYIGDTAPAAPDSSTLLKPSSEVMPTPEPTVQETPQYELLPIGFQLPEGFSVSGAQQDLEKTIYLLDNTALDDVVLTLEKAKEPYDFSKLTAISLDGFPAYAGANSDFKMLAFVKDDVLHIFTCKYELGTLISLASEIL